MSFVPSLPTDCRIISTLILLAASVLNTANAVPGLSSNPMTDILTVSLSAATPVTSNFSIFAPSLTTVPSERFKLDRTTNSTLYFFAISTERL